MILTLHTYDKTTQIEIGVEQFTQLRNPNITKEEIEEISISCDINLDLLFAYVADLKKTHKEAMEIDGSCDYSDHL